MKITIYGFEVESAIKKIIEDQIGFDIDDRYHEITVKSEDMTCNKNGKRKNNEVKELTWLPIRDEVEFEIFIDV